MTAIAAVLALSSTPLAAQEATSTDVPLVTVPAPEPVAPAADPLAPAPEAEVSTPAETSATEAAEAPESVAAAPATAAGDADVLFVMLRRGRARVPRRRGGGRELRREHQHDD